MMPSKERENMKNSERVEELLLVRNVRKNLNELDMTVYEKAMSLRALEDYEIKLLNDIEASHNNAKLMEELNFTHDIERVEVPIEYDRPTYPELLEVGLVDSYETKISTLNKLVEKLDTSSPSMVVLLKALREHCQILENLKLIKENTRRDYPEFYQEDVKSK